MANKRRNPKGYRANGDSATVPKPENLAAGSGGHTKNPEQVAQTWWRYLVTVTGDAAQRASPLQRPSTSPAFPWQRGTNSPRAEAFVAPPGAYGRSPVEALVAAGYLFNTEVGWWS